MPFRESFGLECFRLNGGYADIVTIRQVHDITFATTDRVGFVDGDGDGNQLLKLFYQLERGVPRFRFCVSNS